MTTTSIEWTKRPGTIGKTWNPTNGCEVCSPGCANCYAMRFAGRFAKPGERYHGLVSIAKNKRAVWTGEARFEDHMLDLPLRWRKPCTVFVNSMSDLFYDGFSNEQIAAVFGVMAACPQHTFIVLTKRARRMREWFGWAGSLNLDELRIFAAKSTTMRVARGTTWPLPNVWLGVSVEDQDAADERIPNLLATPAAVRLVSCEPLLGKITLTDVAPQSVFYCDALSGTTKYPISTAWKRIDWVIAGCESGPRARACDVAWLRFLRDQCRAAGTAFFLKQAVASIDRCGYHPDNEPETGCRACCTELGVWAGRGSKRKPGGVIGNPYLDGVQHNAFPVAA